VLVEIVGGNWVATVVAIAFDVDEAGRVDVGSAVATSSFAALDRVFVPAAGVGVSDSVALTVPASFDNPGTLSITDPPLTGLDAVAFVVEVEAAPVPGSLNVILEVPVGEEYSGREWGAGRSDVSWWK